MIDYKNCKCTLCHKPLHEGDDMVVCPECGAPYHRGCYEKAGACVYQDRHSPSFSFADTEEGSKNSSVTCPSCGAQNGADNIFCERCGAALRGGQPNQGQAGGQGPAYTRPPEGYHNQPGFTAADPAGGYQFAAEYNGISTRDWSIYIGRSASYYLYQFDRMDARGKKTSVCWSALLFAPLYFCFRRMWGWGLLALAASLALSVPNFLIMFQTLGMPLGMMFSAGALDVASTVCWVLQWVISVVFAVYAFHLFRKDAAKKIHAMKDVSASEADYQARLQRRSGPSALGVALVIGVIFGLSMVLTAVIGPERLLAMSNMMML